MKLHLEQKVTLTNVPPKIDPIKSNNIFIYYASSYVVICDLLSSKILHKFKYSDVQIMKIHKNYLYICTNEIYILDLEKYELVDVIKLSKALINKICFYDDNFIISKIDNKISFFNGKRKVFDVLNDKFCENVFIGDEYCGFFDCDKAVIYSNKGLKIQEYESDNIVGMYSFSNLVYMLLSSGSLIELISQKIIEMNFEVQSAFFTSEAITAVSGNTLLSFTYSGSLLNTTDIYQSVEKYSGTIDDHYTAIQDQLNCQLPREKGIKKIKINQPSYEETETLDEDSYMSRIKEESFENITSMDSNDSRDDFDVKENNGKDSYDENEFSNDDSEEIFENDSENSNQQIEADYETNNNLEQEESFEAANEIEFFLLDSDLIKTSENDYIFFDFNGIKKIYTFPDDLTDSIQFSNYLILSTSSGFLKYIDITKYTSGDYLCDSKIVRIHNCAISCIKLFQNIVVTGSNDKSIAFLKVESTSSGLKFTYVYRLDCFSSFITAIVFQDNFLAVSTRDNVLQIFKSEETLLSKESLLSASNFDLSSFTCKFDPECLSLSLFFHSFENISTQKPHLKHINHLSLTSKFIITSSADKTAKVIDLNGTIVKTITSDKVLCSSFDSNYIAICSQKGAKIFHNPSLSPITSFQSKRPILASYFYKGYFLAISDILRIYDIDKRKCVKTYDLDLVNCWCFNFPFACGENKIVIFEDTSAETYDKLMNKFRTIKEDTILFEKFIREKNYEKALEISLSKADEIQIFKVICAAYDSDKNLTFLSNFMTNGEIKSKIFDILIKNSGFKSSEVLNKITDAFDDRKLDKQRKEKLREIIKKHCDAIDEIYIELLGLEIFKK